MQRALWPWQGKLGTKSVLKLVLQERWNREPLVAQTQPDYLLLFTGYQIQSSLQCSLHLLSWETSSAFVIWLPSEYFVNSGKNERVNKLKMFIQKIFQTIIVYFTVQCTVIQFAFTPLPFTKVIFLFRLLNALH